MSGTNVAIQKTTREQNVTDTSIDAYYKLFPSGQAKSESKKCLEAWFELGEASNRMISEHTGIERSNIPRSRKDLSDSGILVFAGKQPCRSKKSNRIVQFWRLKSIS